jgi:2-iminobutanoate/2-iminopropanoate deaminase
MRRGAPVLFSSVGFARVQKGFSLRPSTVTSTPSKILKCTLATTSSSGIKIISSHKAPAAIGPYSQATVANGFLFVSGCLGIDPTTSQLVGDTVEAQAEQAMKNMEVVLEAGGSSFSQVAKVTILLTDMNHFSKVNEIYSKRFPTNPPSRTTFAVKGLPKNALVEIECIATSNRMTNA